MNLLKSLINFELGDFFRELWGATAWVEVLLDVVGVIVVSTFCLLIVILLIWLERKVIARFQDRNGPNRVGGRWGLGQTIADVLKLLTKENIMPAGADSLAYNLAPFLIVMSALVMWAVVPFAPGLIGVDLNIGLFYILSVSSASVVCLLLAGWGSNNKYALLGAFRAVAQLVSYEVPMVISMLIPIILARSMSTEDLIAGQASTTGLWYVFMVPLAALVFFISALAETGRQPFDLLEAESEIVAGFHVEYTGMKFGMFFLAEFVSTLLMSGLTAIIFFGGYRFFGLESIEVNGWQIGNLIGLVIFFVKMFLVYFLFMWVRATLPRVRIDQLMDLNWKFLVPLSLVMLLAVVIIDKLFFALGGDSLTQAINLGLFEIHPAAYLRTAVHFASNAIIALVTLEILRRRGIRRKAAYESQVQQREAIMAAHATD